MAKLTHESRLAKMAMDRAVKKFPGLRTHVSAQIWEAIVVAEMAWLILGQAGSMDHKYGPAKALIQATVDAVEAN